MFKNLKIRTKLIVAALTIVITVTAVNGLSIFYSAKKRLQDQVLSDLRITAEIKKQYFNDYLKHIKSRAADFASDGLIRSNVEKITKSSDAKGKKDLSNELSGYLMENKQILEMTIYGMNIFDMNEDVIASTSGSEVGIHEEGDEYFLEAKDLRFGDSYIGEIFFGRHFNVGAPTIAVSVPIFDLAGEERIGVLVNYNDTDRLNDVFRVLSPAGDGSLASSGGEKQTMETYLVNNDGLMISQSIFIKDSILKERVDTEPVRKCREEHVGMSGLYNDYRGIPVYGASLCLDGGWTLLAEIDQSEILKNFAPIQKNILFLFLSISFGASMFVYFMSRGIIGRIQKLSESAKKIGEGNLLQKIEIESNDEIGQLSQVFNSMEEKLKESYEELKREKNISERRAEDLYKFKLALDNASDLVVITDPEGVILYVNKTIKNITGYSREEAIGERPSLWGRQMSAEFFNDMWDKIKNKKVSFSSELVNKRKSGEKYDAEIYITPIFNPDKEIEFFVGIERDITRLKEVDKAKNEFVSLASHQLLTPLTTIRWFVEILLDSDGKNLTKEQIGHLKDISRVDDNMIDLVKALLDVSRIEIGTFSIEPEPVNLKDIIDGILEELIPRIKGKKIKIVKNYMKAVPIMSMDSKLIRIVFQNILTNAVKYVGDKGSVAIDMDQKDSEVLISFADNGCGIPKKDYPKVFSKFYRGENVRLKEPDGTGLGLYIVKSIIDHSGGKIWFESEEGKGTTFHISYPLEGMSKKAGEKSLI